MYLRLCVKEISECFHIFWIVKRQKNILQHHLIHFVRMYFVTRYNLFIYHPRYHKEKLFFGSWIKIEMRKSNCSSGKHYCCHKLINFLYCCTPNVMVSMHYKCVGCRLNTVHFWNYMIVAYVTKYIECQINVRA